MMLNSMDPMGVAVSTSPPPRFSTRSPAPRVRSCSAKGEHVLGGAPEPVQRRDHEGVACDERLERPVEGGPGCPGARDAAVEVEVVAPDAGAQEIRLLPVGGLLPGVETRA